LKYFWNGFFILIKRESNSFFIGFFVPDETAATALSDGIGSIVVVPVMMIYLYFLYTDLKQNPPKVATVA